MRKITILIIFIEIFNYFFYKMKRNKFQRSRICIGLANKFFSVFFNNVLPVVINDLLPSFRQHHILTFIKLRKSVNQLRFYIMVVIEIVTIQLFKIETKCNQMWMGQNISTKLQKCLPSGQRGV